MNAGLLDLQHGKIEDATVKLERAIALAPDKTEPQQRLAETYESVGRANEALRTYVSLLKLTPDDLDTRLKVAQLHRRLGNFAEARAQYQQIISQNHTSLQAGIALEAIEEIDAQTNQPSQLAALNAARLRRNAKGQRLGPVLPQTPLMTGDHLTLVSPTNPLNLPDTRGNATPWSTLRPLEAPDPENGSSFAQRARHPVFEHSRIQRRVAGIASRRPPYAKRQRLVLFNRQRL